MKPNTQIIVNKAPTESAFGGWVGYVNEIKESRVAGEMVSVRFDNPVYGSFADVPFLRSELVLADGMVSA